MPDCRWVISEKFVEVCNLIWTVSWSWLTAFVVCLWQTYCGWIWTGVRSCYDEGKRTAETLTMDYHRGAGVEVISISFLLRFTFLIVVMTTKSRVLCGWQLIMILIWVLIGEWRFCVRKTWQVRIARIFNTYGPRMCIDDGRVVSNFVAQVKTRFFTLLSFGGKSWGMSFLYLYKWEIEFYNNYGCWQALRKEPLTVYGDGKQTRSFQYVSDLVRHPNYLFIVLLKITECVKMKVVNSLFQELWEFEYDVVVESCFVFTFRGVCVCVWTGFCSSLIDGWGGQCWFFMHFALNIFPRMIYCTLHDCWSQVYLMY